MLKTIGVLNTESKRVFSPKKELNTLSHLEPRNP